MTCGIAVVARSRSARWRAALWALGLTWVLGACTAEDDTVVALNITLAEVPRMLSSIDVKISRDGKGPFETTLEPPAWTQDAGAPLVGTFFERLSLPDSWTSGEATVFLQARDAQGNTLTRAQKKFGLREGEAVAVYITLGEGDAGGEDPAVDGGEPDPKMEEDGGAEDGGAEDDSGEPADAPGDSATESDAAIATDSGVPDSDVPDSDVPDSDVPDSDVPDSPAGHAAAGGPDAGDDTPEATPQGALDAAVTDIGEDTAAAP